MKKPITSRFVLALSFTLLYHIPILAQGDAPGIQWQKSWWSPSHPDYTEHPYLTSPEQPQTFSGEDWIYDIAGMVIDGVPGCVFGGYSREVNYEISGPCHDCTLGSHNICHFEENGYVLGCRQGKIFVTDVNGNVIWYKVLEKARTIYGIIQADDGGFIGVGESFFAATEIGFNPEIDPQDPDGTVSQQIACCNGCRGTGEECPHFYIVKLDQQGDVVWEYIYGIEDPQLQFPTYGIPSKAYGIVEGGDGNYFVAGFTGDYTETFTHPGQYLDYTDRVFVVEIDEKGRMLQSNLIGAQEKPVNARNIARDASGDLFIAGFEYQGTWAYDAQASPTHTFAIDVDAIVMKLDPSDLSLIAQYNIPGTLSAGDNQNFSFDIDIHPGTQDVLLPVVFECTACRYGENGKGEAVGKIYRIKNDLSQIENVESIGTIKAFDLQMGVTATADGGYAVLSTIQQAPYAYTSLVSSSCHISVLGPEYWNTDAIVVKYDENNNKVWEKIIDTHEPFMPYGYTEVAHTQGDVKAQECMYRIEEIPYGGFMLVGNNSANFDDDYAIKLFGDCQASIPNQEFDFDKGVDITANTTWDTDKLVKGSVVVKDGYTLTIENCTVQFADSRMIGYPTNLIVEPGGKLVVDAAILTRILDCYEGMWDGIQVLGNKHEAQFATSSSTGVVELKDGAVIAHARIGILADQGWYTRALKLQVSNNATGGQILAENAAFLNNRKAIAFMQYAYRNSSEIKDCTFETNAYMRSSDYRNNDGTRQGHTEFISLWDNFGLKVYSSAFTTTLGANFNLAHDKRGVGIRSISASYQVIGGCINPLPQDPCYTGPCQFEGLTMGIDAQGLVGLNAYLLVYKNTFTQVQRGIRLAGSNFGHIHDNSFFLSDIVPADVHPDFEFDTYGIRTEFANGFDIRGNTFSLDEPMDRTYGTIVRNSTFRNLNTGSIPSLLGNNEYTYHQYGIQTEQYNGFGKLGLAINCNSLTAHQTGIGVAPSGIGSLRGQGTGCGVSDHRPGNDFYSITCDYDPPLVLHIKVGLSDLVYYDDPDNPAPSNEDCVKLFHNGTMGNTPANYTYCFSDLEAVDCSYTSIFSVPYTEGQSPIEITKASLRGIIGESEDPTEIVEARADLVRLLLYADSVDAAIAQVDALPGAEKYYLLAATGYGLGNAAMAREWLDSIAVTQGYDTVHYNVLDILLTALEAGRGMDSLNAGELSQLHAMHQADSAASVLAENVLGFLNDTLYHRLAELWPQESGKRDRQHPEQILAEEEIWLGQNVPNPATGHTTIPYKVPDDVEVYLELADLQGRRIAFIRIPGGYNALELSLQELPRGMLIYRLIVSGYAPVTRTLINL